MRVYIQNAQKGLKQCGLLEKDEFISGVLDEVSFVDTMNELSAMESSCLQGGNEMVKVSSMDMYDAIQQFEGMECKNMHCGMDAQVDTKYKTVAKKVKPVALPLPPESKEKMDEASMQPNLRDPNKIGHKFTQETLKEMKIGDKDFLSSVEKECFEEMLVKHGKAFAFQSHEIGCVDPSVIAPMVIFTVPHVPWNLRPIPVPKALLPKLMELLKEKIKMGILEPSCAPYSNRWFTVPKKNGALRFIQDMQPVNKVTIRNVGTGPIVDEFAEAFAGKSIYSMGDLYSGYDQFQLDIQSRDLTTMKTPLGLVRMCTLPQGATNSVAHMMNGMNKVLRDFIPQITMPFLDDVPIKGCDEREKDKALDSRGCRKFVANHIKDCDKILSKLEEVNLTLSGLKSVFGVGEVLIVGHLCTTNGRRPCPAKIDAIQRMKETCINVTEVRRFLGACVFYLIWIPHYAHVADPLYQLLRKNQKFLWSVVHVKAMQKLKQLLQTSPTLRKVDYECGRPVIVTVDTSPTGIGWAVGQDDEDDRRYVIRFGAKVLSIRQRNYPQIKRELWGVVTALKCEK